MDSTDQGGNTCFITWSHLNKNIIGILTVVTKHCYLIFYEGNTFTNPVCFVCIQLPPIGDRNGGHYNSPPGSFPGSPTNSKGSGKRARNKKDKKSNLKRSVSWDGSDSGSSLAWVAKDKTRHNNWVSPKVGRKGQKGKKGLFEDDFAPPGKKGGNGKGLDWMDIAHNPLSKKPPSGANLYAIKVTWIDLNNTTR